MKSRLTIDCRRISAEGNPSERSAPMRVTLQGVDPAFEMNVIRQADPRDIVREHGPRSLLEHIDEAEARKHYGWS